MNRNASAAKIIEIIASNIDLYCCFMIGWRRRGF